MARRKLSADDIALLQAAGLLTGIEAVCHPLEKDLARTAGIQLEMNSFVTARLCGRLVISLLPDPVDPKHPFWSDDVIHGAIAAMINTGTLDHLSNHNLIRIEAALSCPPGKSST